MAPNDVATAASWEEFVRRVEALAPGVVYTRETELGEFPAYRRIRITRWLADFFTQPTALEVVEQFRTLGEAFDWVESAIAAGETPRHGTPSPAGSGASTRVRLRPVLDRDIVPLYLASFDPAVAGQWRYRGRTVGIEEFVGNLFQGTLAQFIVEMVDTQAAIGLVSAYDENWSGRHCKIAFLRCGERELGDSAAVFEGMMLFISYLFDNFSFRKLFAEVPAYNMTMFSSDFAEEEGVLKDFYFHKGQYVDLHFVSISRGTWGELSALTGW